MRTHILSQTYHVTSNGTADLSISTLFPRCAKAACSNHLCSLQHLQPRLFPVSWKNTPDPPPPLSLSLLFHPTRRLLIHTCEEKPTNRVPLRSTVSNLGILGLGFRREPFSAFSACLIGRKRIGVTWERFSYLEWKFFFERTSLLFVAEEQRLFYREEFTSGFDGSDNVSSGRNSSCESGSLGEILFLKFLLKCSKNRNYFIVKNSYWNSIKRNDFATGSSSNYFELWVGFLEILLRGLKILRCSKNKDYFIAKDSHRNLTKRENFSTGNSTSYCKTPRR